MPKKKYNPRKKIYFPNADEHRAIANLADANLLAGRPLNTISKIAVAGALTLARRPDNIAALRKAGFPTEALFV
jgi:hypothetical protein